ncbi:hypothetical protein MUK42_25962 [Musa troglodytarum]|uniref:Uncharacterized protein n=1 Tax=Musa troglodytarum TaxID=320322 RepID=A0A9E7IK30_9LILI|nr:hypothetical protein MUK42_25962 [Musa troglodytarum]
MKWLPAHILYIEHSNDGPSLIPCFPSLRGLLYRCHRAVKQQVRSQASVVSSSPVPREHVYFQPLLYVPTLLHPHAAPSVPPSCCVYAGASNKQVEPRKLKQQHHRPRHRLSSTP